MTRLKDMPCRIRSKNAGPFWITIDIFCADETCYRRMKQAKNITPSPLGQLFSVPAETVKLFHLDRLKVIKISFPRPQIQGSARDFDMHAGQQYVRLLDLVIEEDKVRN